MKLLPCPFCGSAHVLGDGEADDNWFECMDCNARGPRTTYIDAIDIDASEEAWNRRAANAPADPALLASVAEWRQLAETQDAIIQRGATLTDPALLALAKFGALVVGDHLSPTGGFTHARYEALDRAGLVAGVIVPGGETGPVAAPGIADAIAALLAPDGAASEGVTDGD